MDALIIDGPARLEGKVSVSGSKNTALPFLFTSLLFDKEIRFTNVPRLWDIETTLHLLSAMGTEWSWNKETGEVSIFPMVRSRVAPYEWVKKMRAGILALGPLVAKYGEAKVSLPGGCAIGARPVNFHLDALRLMGVKVEVEEGYICARVDGKLKGAEIVFPQVTVTGTENILVAAVCAEGWTVLENAASEPEVTALCEWLARCGATIEGIGTSRLRVLGGGLKAPTEPVRVPPDRIEAGTWVGAAVVTRSELTITDCDPGAMTAVLDAYRAMGVRIEESAERGELKIAPCSKYQPLDIETSPYPGFATDMQAQILTTLCLAEGKSQVRETIFENRFMHVAELRRLGARIEVQGNLATVEGPTLFKGAPIMATDLRASASLVLAGLCAEGQTRISRIYHLDRGYQRLDEKLRALGARIERISEEA